MLSVSQLFIYPVKSLAGIALNSANVTDRGLQYDRRFMLIDENNCFLTQRKFPEMALLRTVIENSSLLVFHKNFTEEKLILPLVPEMDSTTLLVKIWDDDCEAQLISDEADNWLSERLKFSCRLVYMPELTKRKVDAKYALDNDITSFADGYPVMIIGQESLDNLNRRLTEKIPMNRFRPSIVFTGGKAFEEDTFEHFRIKEVNFYGVKLSARCVIATTNQDTAVTGKEPLKTLSGYRMKNNKIYFGQNLLVKGIGRISTGDQIEIVKQSSKTFLKE